jgi:hypothetical protein
MQKEDTRTPAPSSSKQFGISEIRMLRIFEGELVPQPTRDGRIDHYQVRGFHLEDAAIMAAHGHTVDERTRTSPDSRGVYRAQVLMFGSKKRHHGAGFFPRGWTRGQVIAAIGQAFTNRQPSTWGEFKNCFKGRTETGMQIVMQLDDAGLMLDAFPLRSKVNPRTEALWRIEHGLQKRSRHVCSQCGRLRVLCCPAGHKVRWRRLKKIRRALKRAHWNLRRMF